MALLPGLQIRLEIHQTRIRGELPYTDLTVKKQPIRVKPAPYRLFRIRISIKILPNAVPDLVGPGFNQSTRIRILNPVYNQIPPYNNSTTE